MERKRRITPPPNNNNNPAVSTTSSRRRRSLPPRPHHQRREYTKEGEQQRYNREYNREALLRKRWHNFLDEYTSTNTTAGEGEHRRTQQKKKQRGKNSPRSVRHPKGSRGSVRKRGRVVHTTKVYGTSSSDDSSSSSSSSSSSDSDTSDEEEQPMNRSSGIHPSSRVNNLSVPAVRSSSLPPMMSYHRRSSSNNKNGRENSYYDVYQQRSQSYQFGDQRKLLKRKNSRDGSRGGGGNPNPLDGFAEFLSGEFSTPNTNRSSGRGGGAANTNRSTTKKNNSGGAQHSRDLQEERRGEEDKMAVLPPLVAYAEFLPDDDHHHHKVVETQEKEEVQQHNDRIPIIRRNSIGNPLTPPLVEKQRVVMVSSPPSSLLREDERRQLQHEEEGRLAVDEQLQQQEQRPQSSTTVEEHYPQDQQHEVHQHFDDDTPFTPWDQTRSSSPLTTIAEESLSNTIDSNRTRDTDVDDDVHHHHHVKFEDERHVKQDERPSTTTKCDVAKDPEGILNYVMSTGQSSSEEGSRIDDSSRSGGTNSSGGGGASSFKQLMKMPYAKRKSNPIDSDEEDNTPDAPPLSTSGATLSDSITTSSTSTSLHTTNTKQTSQWSVGEGSSSTDTTSDLNIAAIRRVKNEREFNTAVRGGEASPVRSGRGTRLEGHIEKGNNTKRVGEKGGGKTAHSPKKKKGSVVSKDKAVKGGGGDNASAVDAIFPKQRRAYSRGSGKKGIRFRDRFMYNWDDGLFDNVAEESSPVPLSCAADVAAGIVSSPIVAGADDSSAPRGSSPTNTADDLPECTSSSADTYKRHDTVSSLKTTATMATADSTVFSGGVPTYSRHNSTTSQYTFSSMKSYLSQSQIRRLEDAPPELTDVLHQQIRILKSRRQDILEKARMRNQSGRKMNISDSIQIENSIEFSLFVMKDKVEQLQQILGPLNVDVDVDLYSTDSSDSGGPCSAATESESSAADGMPFRAAGGALAA